ncbi:MAG: hypothetical protein HZB17_00445, partial [Chloroflexi bacterium]|nr:hypothetical protein [Chloroflexota bacterium]
MTDGPPYYVGPKSNFEIILDPTGKLGGGYVYHAHMEGVPPPLTNTNDKHGFHRPSSPFHITEGNGPWAVSSDVFLKVNPDESYSNLGDDIVGKWLSIVSAGISTPQVAYDIKAGAFLVTGYGVPHLELYRVQNGGAGRVQGLSSYNPPLEFDLSKKHSVRLEFILIDEKPYVRLFQDGTFIDMTRIDDNAAKLPGSLF